MNVMKEAKKALVVANCLVSSKFKKGTKSFN